MSKIINLYGSDTDSDDDEDAKEQKKISYDAFSESESEQEEEEQEQNEGENFANSDDENGEIESEEEDEDDEEGEDEDEENHGFSVREDFQNDSEEEEEKMLAELKKKKEKKPKKEEIPLEDVPVGKPKFVKPLDYQKLKSIKQQKGVVFLSRPPKDYCNKDKIIKYLEPYGKVTRIKEDYVVKGNRKILSGFYIEFEKKSIAKRVALSLNMHRINFRDSRMLQFKYVPDFDFTELEEDDALEKLKKKLLVAEAEKELRQVKQYQDYKGWSEKIKKGELPAPTQQIKFSQQKMKRERDPDHHLHFIPVILAHY